MPASRSAASVCTACSTCRHVGSVLIDMWRSVKTTHSRGASKAGAIDGAGTFSMSWRADFDRVAAAATLLQYCRVDSRRKEVLWCSMAALARIDGMAVQASRRVRRLGKSLLPV